MTVEAVLFTAMLSGMTLTAIESGVFVRVELIEPLLIIVTGDADRFDLIVITEIELKRLMRIVTSGAVLENKVAPFGT